MKVAAADVERVRLAIEGLDTDETRKAYREGNFPRADRVNDLNKRYRWDLYNACGQRIEYDNGVRDNHIDTALRSIVPPL